MEQSIKATTDALAAAGVQDIAELVTQRDQARQQAEEFGDQPGALGTTSAKEKSDVQEEGETPDWMALHEKMLAGN